ncbi:Uncharacterized protein FKW44_018591 [Caligus rogercresseyi]|uniref:Uncharacterized protein n=1 Tax=Caligus rogercresseyi TaxID=217165 RepID=A0A7T8GUL6_CALRO|nr:Uncharacterized protein FKW44_018591 [Caligus rogercresseyi]
MASSYEEVQGYKWNEEFLRSAGVITLVNNGARGDWDVDVTIKRAYKEEDVARKVRDTDIVDKVMKMTLPVHEGHVEDLGCHEKQ